ncbi:DUF1571 domain-containing protein [Gemmata sp. JC673]|uniref:DUF1571 domain-containing protein n=1 Tax=Gemmata algarum TaxID=2975278 RepID=A0ABU5EZ07_9BACT|nr:DUF1571 domain-containing protein [Gemmata algarum]MDY3559857.1 DUF1571 domain-containing protein [Gemmata algarum]
MNRVFALIVAVLALIACGGYVAYDQLFRAPPPPPPLAHEDHGDKLPTQNEFDTLARTDPVKALSMCLTRYQREVHGMRCVLEKQERVQGKPEPPQPPPVEVLELCVRGDVPDPETKKTAIEVAAKWRSGARSFLGSEITGTLFSERPEAEGGLGNKAVTWRPKAFVSKLSTPIPPDSPLATGQSRYCVRDAGLYRTMLRTHEAWKDRQETGKFKYEYLGTKPVEKAGNRECHVIRRMCEGVEVDAFQLGGAASKDPKVIAAEGFTEVTIFIDRERWLQVATETLRDAPGGTKVTIGTYYFRDIELNPTFPPDTFTAAWLKTP